MDDSGHYETAKCVHDNRLMEKLPLTLKIEPQDVAALS